MKVDRFIRIYNHYIGTDCESMEDILEEVEEYAEVNGDKEGTYYLFEVLENFLREGDED